MFCDQFQPSLHTSYHFINGSCKLQLYISYVFTCMLHHGYTSQDFLLSVLIPIPKNKRKSLCDSDNYRAIALGSILSKLFDKVIMKKQENVLLTSNLQFGFKPNCSTMQCTFVAQECIQYYTNNGSDVFACLLDASKAFDRINYTKLFNILLERNMCPMIIRFLINQYTKQKLCVKWNTIESETFDVLNGVKQGGVLSPILFTVYID